MAYLTLLASVPETEVEAVRQDPLLFLHPTMVSAASHLLSYWVKVQPLGKLLQEAIDGGELLHKQFWHPLMPPMFHRPNGVRSLAELILVEWNKAESGAELLQDDDWLRLEIGRLLKVYKHAAAAGECIVTALERPADDERANRVRMPWKA